MRTIDILKLAAPTIELKKNTSGTWADAPTGKIKRVMGKYTKYLPGPAALFGIGAAGTLAWGISKSLSRRAPSIATRATRAAAPVVSAVSRGVDRAGNFFQQHPVATTAGASAGIGMLMARHGGRANENN